MERTFKYVHPHWVDPEHVVAVQATAHGGINILLTSGHTLYVFSKPTPENLRKIMVALYGTGEQ